MINRIIFLIILIAHVFVLQAQTPKIVVLDPGHGWSELPLNSYCYPNPSKPATLFTTTRNGATYTNEWNPCGRNYNESYNVLQISLLLRNKLEMYCGSDVVVEMTRDEHVEANWLDLNPRAQFSEDKNADLFLSIHTDALDGVYHAKHQKIQSIGKHATLV